MLHIPVNINVSVSDFVLLSVEVSLPISDSVSISISVLVPVSFLQFFFLSLKPINSASHGVNSAINDKFRDTPNVFRVSIIALFDTFTVQKMYKKR